MYSIFLNSAIPTTNQEFYEGIFKFDAKVKKKKKKKNE
jgi:hypothetical protein